MKRLLLAAGGTGGHIYPAIAVADAFRKRYPDIEIRIAGAKGGMEERLVPQAGYRLEALPIAGLQRSLTLNNILRNLKLPFRVAASIWQAHRLVSSFKPEAVIGFGGYASLPVLFVAQNKTYVTAIQEQNAWPGMANRILSGEVDFVFMGNEAARPAFKKAQKPVYSGNPVRASLLNGSRLDALKAFGFDPQRPVLVLLGGSLGARRLNDSILAGLDALNSAGVQLLWQCGRLYYEELKAKVPERPGLRLQPFIDDMGAAYAAADLVISRAGAISISEIAMLRKPAILVPSPNVAEDHQTKNARSLSDSGAAVLVPDADATALLAAKAIELLGDLPARQSLATALSRLPRTDACQVIVDEVSTLFDQRMA